MTKFIHTADWQIGKPYLQVEDEQKRFKLQQERINVISRIIDIAIKEKSEFILVAGDLFDSPTPSSSTVLEVLEVIGSIDIPVIVIPGNHDHGALGTIWYREDFKRYQSKFANNLTLLIERKPIEINQTIIFPCPLLRKKDLQDPTLWLRDLDWTSFSPKKIRIILAHGSVQTFTGRDYLIDSGNLSGSNNLIDLGALPKHEIDYIALGDWHNLKQINEQAWYSGTPEPDRFNQGENNQRGQILNVELVRGERPLVKSMPTGRIQWHNLKVDLNSFKDLDRLDRQIDELTSGRIAQDLIRLEISGYLSFEVFQRFEQLKFDLENKLLRLRIKGECKQVPQLNELDQLIKSVDNPLIADVAKQLQEQLIQLESPDTEQAAIIHCALSELFRLSVKVK